MNDMNSNIERYADITHGTITFKTECIPERYAEKTQKYIQDFQVQVV